MKYEYNVDYLEAEVTDKDVAAGEAWGKITAQTETLLTDKNEQGWEYYRSELIATEVKETSCFGRETGNSDTRRVLIFIFRRQVQ